MHIYGFQSHACRVALLGYNYCTSLSIFHLKNKNMWSRCKFWALVIHIQKLLQYFNH